MANKILVARGTKARLEEIKSTLAANELVYSTDTGELGVKKANGNIEYFMNATDINASKQDKLIAGDNISIVGNTISASVAWQDVENKPELYNKTEIDTKLVGKANATHNHDTDYYKKSEITSLLAGKQSAITGAATTITSSDLTKNRALISNGSGKVAVSPVTSTELGYLSGVTSSIQTQLNSKLSASDVSAWAKKSSLDHGDIPYATSNTKGGVRVKVVGTSVYIYTTD